jgi:regulator of sirC expression with transglutaminase-like and TPR domain
MSGTIGRLGLVEDAEIELDRAALDLAALDHPGVALDGYLDLLDMVEARLRDRGHAARGPAEQADGLAEVLAGDFGFEGDRDTYDDPANADLIRVLDRRRGLPIALSILYVAMARRLGWSAHALNTPSHVLVAVGSGQPLTIDPFGRGAVVRPDRLAGHLRSVLGRGGAAAPEHVAPMSNRAALVRLLMNQATRAERAREPARALTVLQRVTLVAPAHSAGWWDRARLELAQGEPAAARMSLTAMLETTRDPRLRARVERALDAIGT